MPRGSRTMTAAMLAAVDRVAQANLARRGLAARIDAEHRADKRDRLNAADMLEAIAVRDALAANAPKVRITDALGTTDPHTISRVLARFDARDDLADFAPKLFRWADESHKVIAVNYPNFPSTTSGGFEDYPAVLSGTVKIDPNAKDAKNGFVVVSDDSDKVMEFGTLPGLLRWEVEQEPVPGSLPAILNEWIGENS